MIIFSIAGFIFLLFFLARIRLHIQFSRKVNELFAQSKIIANQKFHKSQLNNLPEPVQRYFKHILKEGQPYISFIRIKHDGKFKPNIDTGWINRNGYQS